MEPPENGSKFTDMMTSLPSGDTMYRALSERDASFDGVFFAAIRTTGIFCRPTCSAKKPLRENVWRRRHMNTPPPAERCAKIRESRT